MTVIAGYDLETNGLLSAKREKDGSLHPPMDRIHTLTLILMDWDTRASRFISAADQPGYVLGAVHTDTSGREWELMPLIDGLKLLYTADLRVGHNSQDFDERAIPLVHGKRFDPPRIPCKSRLLTGFSRQAILDTLVLSRAIYPDIHRTGPNTHKLPGWMKSAHSLKGWGYRLGDHKGDYKGGWESWSAEMQDYGEQDTCLMFLKLFKWLMAQKPSTEMIELEHMFAEIIRRQETRGMAFDYDKAAILLAELQDAAQGLEAGLIDTFGDWWEWGKSAHSGAGSAKDDPDHQAKELEDDDELEDDEEQDRRQAAWLKTRQSAEVMVPAKTRQVKMVGFADVTRPRYNAAGKRMAKDYVGPAKITYTMGAPYTPIKRVQFNPSSRTHIIKRLKVQFDWIPTKFTKKTAKGGGGNPIVDDEVLRGLPWPQAQKLADYFLVLKRIGQLATGKKAWLKVAVEHKQPDGSSIWRVHGRVNTCGALGGRCTHMDPNMAQCPKNSAEANNPLECVRGYRCRELFYAP